MSDEQINNDPTIMHKAKDRMGNSRARLLLQQPFYGVLLSMIDFIPEWTIPTMATDGSKVFYNPKYAMEITDDETYGVLLHEISHCIYMHCTRKRRLNREHKRWNFAIDYAVNQEIKDMGYALPGHVLYDQKYREMNAEQIYDALPEDCQGLTGETLDMHIENNDESSWDDMEDRILTAYEMCKDAKGKGNLPAGLKRWIDKLRRNKVKWERIFHKYVGQALSKDDYSYTRCNKRFMGQDIFLPDSRNPIIGSVVIGVDTSGSITKEFLTQVASEIHKISHLVNELVVMTCDTKVHETIKVRKFENWLSKIQFKGQGGTDFDDVFNEVKKMKMAPELLIYITDGYGSCSIEKNPPYPVIWVLESSDGESSLPKWGNRVVVPSYKK